MQSVPAAEQRRHNMTTLKDLFRDAVKMGVDIGKANEDVDPKTEAEMIEEAVNEIVITQLPRITGA